MKIAQVTPFYPPSIGGVENVVSRISEILAKRGHEVHVYTANDGLPSYEMVNEVHVHRFPIWSRIGRFASFWPGFLPHLKRENFDLVHTHVYRHPHSTFIMLNSVFSKSKTVLSTHGPFHPLRIWGRLAPFVYFYDLTLGRGLNLFERVLIQSGFERRFLRKLHVKDEKIRLLPNGFDSSHLSRYDASVFCNKYGIDKGYFCYLGRIHPTKGLEFFLQSFARMTKADGNATLVIAGSGDRNYENSLRNLALDLGLNGRVRFTGYLAEEEKMSMLEGCGAFVLPSVYEPYGIVALEAMAHGKPVIATYPGGVEEIVKNNFNGFL